MPDAAKTEFNSIVKEAVTNTLNRQDVPLDNAATPATTAKVEAAISAGMKGADNPIAVVEVGSAAGSKVNWAQVISLVASLLATFGIIIPAEWQATILQILVVATPIITIILRTFFSKKVLAPSLR